MPEFQAESDRPSPGIVERLSYAAALCGGCVVLAAGALIVASILARWLLRISVPGDVELVQAATALGAFAFLPFGQLSRSNIVVDTFTQRLPERICRRIDAFWDLIYGVVTLVLGWRLGIGAFDAWRSHTVTTVLGLPVGVFMAVGTVLLVLLAVASVVTMRRLLRGPE